MDEMFSTHSDTPSAFRSKVDDAFKKKYKNVYSVMHHLTNSDELE